MSQRSYYNPVRSFDGLSLKCEVSTVVNDCYSSGEKAVSSSSCAGFDGPESRRMSGRGNVQVERGQL